MPSVKNTIFSAILYDELGKPVDGLSTSIQFFDISSNKWITVVTDVLLKSGVLSASVSASEAGASQPIAMLWKLFEVSAPQFRCIRSEQSPNSVLEILSNGGKVIDIARKGLTIDFGSLWLVNKDFLNEVSSDKNEKSILIALPIPSLSSKGVELQKKVASMEREMARYKQQIDKLNSTIASDQDNRKNNDLEIQNLRQLIEHLGTENKSLSRQVDELDISEENYKNDISRLVKNLEDKNIQLKECYSNREELNGKILLLQQENDLLNASLDGVNKKLMLAEQKIAELTALIARLKANLTDSLTELSTKEGIVNDQNTKIQVLNKRIEEATNEKIEIGNVIKANMEQIAKLTGDLKQKTLDSDAKTVQITELQTQIDKLNAQILEIKKIPTEHKAQAHPVSRVYSSILDEIKKTNEFSAGSPFRLTGISLNLKTFVEQRDDGTYVQLVDAKNATTAHSGAMSDFKVDIANESTPSDGRLRVPDLSGLTESGVRKILDPLGLRLSPVYQVTDSSSVPNGQSFKQSPAKGEDVSPNSTITVIFSKK